MSEIITLELPADLMRQARQLAAATNRRFEDAVAEWIERAVTDPPVEALPDAQVLSLTNSSLPGTEQDEISALLARKRERELSPTERVRLDELLETYRRGLVLKARATKEAVARGLVPRLDGDAA